MNKEALKVYNTKDEVSFEDVLDVLNGWESGSITREEAMGFAESLFYLGEPRWPDLPRSDERSVLFAVLEALEMMYTNPTLKSDIPALRKFLVDGQTSPIEAWRAIPKPVADGRRHVPGNRRAGRPRDGLPALGLGHGTPLWPSRHYLCQSSSLALPGSTL